MQMRIDGEQPVEVPCEKAADDSLADRLACMEGPILTHVAEVGRDERQATRPELASGSGGELELNKFAVRLIQAATEDYIFRQRRWQPHQAFAVRKRMNLYARIRDVSLVGQSSGSGFILRKSEKD